MFVTFERKLRVHLARRPPVQTSGEVALRPHAPGSTVVHVPAQQAPIWVWPMGSTGWTPEGRRKGKAGVLLLTCHVSRRSLAEAVSPLRLQPGQHLSPRPQLPQGSPDVG